jgi:hypothetical protein
MTDPILTALAQMEARFVERMGECRRELRREIQLDMNAGFDAVNQRLDRLHRKHLGEQALEDRVQEIEGRLPPE